MGSDVLHVVVVGFHHKKGCQVEYCYPPLPSTSAEQCSSTSSLPSAWQHLPTLALPDGVHNLQEDTTFFVLPSLERNGGTVFGVSCYRQMDSDKLHRKEADVTRSSVQKCVIVLSRRPLYGVLPAKLQLITHAYFEERDFSKVEVLSAMYNNLCSLFDQNTPDHSDGDAAIMGIDVRRLLLTTLRHRLLVLFKLLLLEKKVLFHVFPAEALGNMIVGIASLVPRLVEDGLVDAATFQQRSLNQSADAVETTVHDVDGWGFPLCIFTQGNLFAPYVALTQLDVLQSDSRVRAFWVGATNVLFVQRRPLADVYVTMEGGEGKDAIASIEFVDDSLRRALSLSTADLRFCDYLIREAERHEVPRWEGSDHFIRTQFRHYLLALSASSRRDLAVEHFGKEFLDLWRATNNYKVWMNGQHDELAGVPPGHPFAGPVGVSDVLLRVEHSTGGQKVIHAMNSTGRAAAEAGARITEVGGKMKSSVSGWFRQLVAPHQPTSADPAVEASQSDEQSDARSHT